MWLTRKALGFISVVGLVGSSIDGDGAGDATPHCVFVACVPSSFPSALVLEELAATIIFWVVDDATPSAAPAAPVAPAGCCCAPLVVLAAVVFVAVEVGEEVEEVDGEENELLVALEEERS